VPTDMGSWVCLINFVQKPGREWIVFPISELAVKCPRMFPECTSHPVAPASSWHRSHPLIFGHPRFLSRWSHRVVIREIDIHWGFPTVEPVHEIRIVRVVMPGNGMRMWHYRSSWLLYIRYTV